MKKRTAKNSLLAGSLTALLAGNLYAEIQAYDGFNVPESYKHRSQLNEQNGGTGFKGDWTVDITDNPGNTQRYIASKTPAVYVDSKGRELQNEAGMMQCKPGGSGKGALRRELAKEMEGTIWISFLTKIDEQIGYGWDIQFLDTKGEMQFKVMNGRAEQNRWRIQSARQASGKPKDGLFESKTGMTPTDPTLVILKVTNAGSGENDGTVTAFLNPTDLRDAEIECMASIKISGLEINAIQTFSFDKKTAAEGYIDELRFGTAIADVLPLK